MTNYPTTHSDRWDELTTYSFWPWKCYSMLSSMEYSNRIAFTGGRGFGKTITVKAFEEFRNGSHPELGYPFDD